MTTIFTPQIIKRFKREATALKKASDITHNEALDHIAKRERFANWSLLMRASSAVEHPAEMSAARQPSAMYGKLLNACTHFIKDLRMV